MTQQHARSALFIVALIAGLLAIGRAQSEPDLRLLFDQHRWFELRAAIGGKKAPSLYVGAVDAAFGRDAAAERELVAAVREAANVDLSNDAREALIDVYLRDGRMSDLVRLLDAAVAAAPSRADFANARAAFAPFAGQPDQSARLGRSRPFVCEIQKDTIVLPLEVNGKPVRWNFDSGFSNVALTESEAERLGIAAQDVSAKAGDMAGATTSMRTGVADRIVIGDAELEHVPVLIFADSQPPYDERPAGSKGTIGLPAAIALRGIRWTRGGSCAVGPDMAIPAGAASNAMFDGGTLVVRAAMPTAPLEFIVDTGNEAGTQLWRRFGDDFPELVRTGRTRTHVASQIGGSNERTVTELPELRFQIGSFDLLLRPAEVFAKPVGNDWQHGNLGMDAYSQADDVRIDFQRMTIWMGGRQR